MEESVLLGTKPLVDSMRHFIRDPSGVCHLCECRIVQWRHDSRLLLLLNWSLHIIKRTSHVGWKLRSLVRYCSCHSNKKFISFRHRVISSIYGYNAMTGYGKCLIVPKVILPRLRLAKKQLLIRSYNTLWWKIYSCGYILQTSNTTLWTLYSLARNPDVQKQLYEEVSSVLQPDELATPATLQKMPFLRGCIKETLRYGTSEW